MLILTEMFAVNLTGLSAVILIKKSSHCVLYNVALKRRVALHSAAASCDDHRKVRERCILYATVQLKNV